MGVEPKRIAARSPWQNGVAERWIGSCRRELLDRVVILNERHLRRLLHDYIAYYARDQCHLALDKDAPDMRSVQSRPNARGRVVAHRRLGGLHHRYAWREAA
jgi:putative transposase